jgi:pentapeptide repeat protein
MELRRQLPIALWIWWPMTFPEQPGRGKTSALTRTISGIAIAVSLAGLLINARKTRKRPEADPPAQPESRPEFRPQDASGQASRAEKKSGWDKASVLVQSIGGLAIFVSLAGLYIGVHQFNDQQRTNAKNMTIQYDQNTLDKYFDDMSDLVLNHKLTTASPDSSIVGIAIARTATALRNLGVDGASKGILIRYLWEAGLILRPKPVLFLYQINLNDAIFQGANLYNAYLSNVSMADAKFNGAELNGSKLSQSVLDGAQLEGTHMACLSRKDCTDLSGAFLVRADLKEADLTGADLTQADLADAELYGADLSGARLAGTDLRGAFYNVRPEEVRNDQGELVTYKPTQWPGGFDPRAAGATCDDC